MAKSVLEYQPYVEAVIQERLSRDAAILGVHESVAGFEALPMSLTHLLVLRIMRHPLLADGTPNPKQLRDFLWLVSPQYAGQEPSSRFTRRCKKLFYPPRYLALFNTRRARMRHEVKRLRKTAVYSEIVESAKAYISEAMQDCPPCIPRRGFEPDYYSDGVAFCCKFGRELHWSPDYVMRAPVKVLFQALNEIKLANGSRVPLCNPSDSVKAQFYRQINEELSRTRGDRNARLRELTLQIKAERKAAKKGRR